MEKKFLTGKLLLLYAALLALLLVILVICVFAYQSHITEYQQQSAYDALKNSAAGQVATVNSTITGQFQAMELIAASLAEAVDSDGEQLRQKLQTLLPATGFSALFYADPGGSSYATNNRVYDMADRWYFQQAMAGNSVVQYIPGGRVDARNHFDIAVPVRRDGEIIGVAVGLYDKDAFRELLRSSIYLEEGCSLVCDSTGAILLKNEIGDCYRDLAADSINELLEESGYDKTQRKDVALAMVRQHSGLISFMYGEQYSYAVYQPLGVNGWILVTIVPEAALERQLSQVRRMGYWFMALAVLLALAFSLVVILLTRRVYNSMKREKKRLEISDQRFRIALDNSSVSIWEYDMNRRRVVMSSQFLQQHSGIKQRHGLPEDVLEQDLVHPDYAEAYREMYRRLYAGEEKVEGVFRVRRQVGGPYCYKHIRYRCIKDEDGRPYRAIGVSEDVTEAVEAKESYQRELQYQRAIGADVAAALILDLTVQSVVKLQFSDPDEQAAAVGLDVGQLFSRAVTRVVDNAAVAERLRELSAVRLIDEFQHSAVNGAYKFSLEYLRRMEDGRERWVRDEIHLMADPDSGHVMCFIIRRDIDEPRRQLDQLTAAAERDAMTGLLTHDAMLAHVRRRLGENSGERYAMFMMDIDRFKSVNDSYGHPAGDVAIQLVAATLRDSFRPHDLVGRVGGDEFMVLMPGVPDRAAVEKKAEELLHALRLTVPGETGGFNISCSIGVVFSRPGLSAEELYHQADQALYQAKERGRNCYALLDPQ